MATNFFLRARHWPIFVLLWGAYFAGQILIIRLLPTKWTVPTGNAVRVGLLTDAVMFPLLLCSVLWLWSLGLFLFPIAKDKVKLNIRLFKFDVIFFTLWVAMVSPLILSKNGGALQASGLNDNGTTVTIARDMQKIKGPNPYIDVTYYSVRAFSATTTATINSGSTTATIAAARGFINGDGIVIRGAGTKNTLATPGAPSVVAVNAAMMTGTGHDVANSSGATTYQYQIVARNQFGGYTVASAVTSIANGAATLGPNSVGISSWTRSNNITTITTASPHNLVTSSLVNIETDPDIAGWYQVTSTPTGSTFTIQQEADTRAGARTANAASSGTVIWWNANRLTWTAVPNAWQYLIYGRTAGRMALIGVSYPENTNLTSDPLHNVFDDYGPTMTNAPGQPDWVPLTPPVAAKNNDLVTTIVSGGGTTTLTLANAASNRVVAATAKFDNAPNIKAAATAAASGGAQAGVLYFPSTGALNSPYTTESFLNLASGQFPSVLSVMQAGPIVLGDTMLIGATTWTGDPKNPLSQPQFSYQKLPYINSSTASPMVYQDAAQTQFSFVALNSGHRGNIIWVNDRGGGIPSCRWENMTFSLLGTDFSGTGLVIRNNIGGGGVMYFKNVTFTGGPALQTDRDPTPLFINTQGIGPSTFENIFLSRRAMYLGAATTGIQATFNNFYCQGCIMPQVSFANFSGAGSVNIFADIINSTQDTTTHPLVAYFGATNLQGNIRIHGTSGLAGNSIVSGTGQVAVEFVTAGRSTGRGQNAAMENPMHMDTAIDGILYSASTRLPQKLLGGSLSIGPPYQGYVNSVAQAAPTCAVSAGGSVALAKYTFTVAPVFPVGTSGKGEGSMSPASTGCTTTRGNQTITINWATVPGAIGYDLYRNGFSFQCSPPFVNGGSSTGYTWRGAAICGQSAPASSGTGPVNMTNQSVVSPTLRSVGATGVGVYNQTPGPLTADRTETKPDFSGTTALTSGGTSITDHLIQTTSGGQLRDTGVGLMNIYDSFKRANGTLQAGNPNWIVQTGAVNITSNAATSATNGQVSAVYTGTSFPTDDQTARMTVGSLSGGAGQIRVQVRASTNANTSYHIYCQAPASVNSCGLEKVVAGTYTNLATPTLSSAPVPGDVLSINARGTTITMYFNGVQVAQAIDASIASGYPGIGFYLNSATATIADFAASYGAVSLNIAQTWNAVQTLGASGGFDANAATATATGLRMPNIAGAEPTTAGSLAYDTTHKGVHAGANGVNNLFGIKPVSVSVANNDCVKWASAASVITLNTLGASCFPEPAINGFAVRAGAGTSAARTLQPSANNGVTWTNGDGVAGDPVPVFVFPSKAWFSTGICDNATPGTSWHLPAAHAPSKNCVTGSNINEMVLDFADADTAQIAYPLPSDWTGAIDARLIFFDSSTSGTVIFQIATSCTATSGSTTDDLAFNAADNFATITLNATANAQWQAAKTGINTTGCSAGNTMQMKIIRATDTAANRARVKGLELTVRRRL